MWWVFDYWSFSMILFTFSSSVLLGSYQTLRLVCNALASFSSIAIFIHIFGWIGIVIIWINFINKNITKHYHTWFWRATATVIIINMSFRFARVWTLLSVMRAQNFFQLGRQKPYSRPCIHRTKWARKSGMG